MEATNYFTCIAYDTVDFLILSRYVVFGIYLDVKKDVKNIVFNNEILPHVHIGSLLEKNFMCKSNEDCNEIIVMRMSDFPDDIMDMVEEFTDTIFPASGNFAVSVNTEISSKNVDLALLRLLPKSIRTAMNECGVSAIGFEADNTNKKNIRKQILISPDKLLRKFFSSGLMKDNEV